MVAPSTTLAPNERASSFLYELAASFRRDHARDSAVIAAAASLAVARLREFASDGDSSQTVVQSQDQPSDEECVIALRFFGQAKDGAQESIMNAVDVMYDAAHAFECDVTLQIIAEL